MHGVDDHHGVITTTLRCLAFFASMAGVMIRSVTQPKHVTTHMHRSSNELHGGSSELRHHERANCRNNKRAFLKCEVRKNSQQKDQQSYREERTVQASVLSPSDAAGIPAFPRKVQKRDCRESRKERLENNKTVSMIQSVCS